MFDICNYCWFFNE